MKAFETIPTGSALEILSYNAREKIAAMALVLFFCSAIMDSAFFRIIPEIEDRWDMIGMIENALIGIPILLCLAVTPRGKRFRVGIFYLIILILFAGTYFLHPEYINWFQHNDYGIYNRFLFLKRGVYALLVMSLFIDERKLLNCIVFSAKLCFIFYVLQYVSASIRGYWTGIDADGKALETLYSLSFGYDMAFPTVVFGCIAFYRKKVSYFIAFLIGAVLVVLAGSRGALLCILGLIPMLIISNWRILKEQSRKVMLIVLLGGLLTILFIAYFDVIVESFLNFLKSLDISSRNIEMLLSGNMTDANGRDEIYSMAMDMIKNGGMFGHGVYGDRYIIGQRFYWGYSHNLFFEVYVSFGYIGGTVFFGVLIYFIVKMILNCNEAVWSMLLTIFVLCSLRLLFSDSFWYNAFFWGLISVLGIWNKQRRLLKKTSDSPKNIVENRGFI